MQVVRTIFRQSHEIFGEPNLRVSNQLGGLDGRGFAKYIEDIASGKIQLEFHEPHIMAENHPIGIAEMRDMAEEILAHSGLSPEELAFFQEKLKVKTQQMSGIARTIYHDFATAGLAFMDKHPQRYDEARRFHFSGFSQTFIQAYDSILFTGIKWANDRDDWNNMKNDMKVCLLHLARIPTDIQEGLMSSHSTINYRFGPNDPYMIPYLEEIWSTMLAHGAQAFAPTLDKLDINDGYAQCPALTDGTLVRSFEALFQIYGAVFFDENGAKK